ncbi:MAG: hypothetical protein IT169_13000 [Bryobacterales bacterium]|nr:hypothetical protein [Bryobacterales bacterium]
MNSIMFSRWLDPRFTGALRLFGACVMPMLLLSATILAQSSGGLKEVQLSTSHLATGTVVINGTSYTITSTGATLGTTAMLDLSKPLVVSVGPTATPKPGIEYRAESFHLFFHGTTWRQETYPSTQVVTIEDPHDLEEIRVIRTRYVEVKSVVIGPGQLRRYSVESPPDNFYQVPAHIYFEAVPDPGAKFIGWDRYGFLEPRTTFWDPEIMVARFSKVTNAPPLMIEGTIPTFHHRSTPQVLEATLRVTAASNVTPAGVGAECKDSRVFYIWTILSNDTTPFDVGLKLATDVLDHNHIPNGEYSCEFRITRQDGGQDVSIPFKVVLGPYTPEPESTDAVAEAVVNAASYLPQSIAAGSIFSIFGKRLATGEAHAQSLPLPTTLASTQVRLSIGGQSWLMPLFYVSPGQVNFLVPVEAPNGGGFLSVIRDDKGGPPHSVTIESTAPALFTTNADGKGAPSGYVIRALGERQERDEIAYCPEGGPCTPLPLISTDLNEDVFLILFGTGFRNDRRSVPEARIGTAMAEVTYFGPHPDFAGLDQINVKIPRALLGSGPQPIVLRHSGKETNEVTVHF